MHTLSPSPFVAAIASTRTLKMGLFELPKELRDQIFGFVYNDPAPLRLVTRLEWDRKEVENLFAFGAAVPLTRIQIEKRMRDSSYIPQPLPPPKVIEFLVSKRWLQCAARAWLALRWVDIRSAHVVTRGKGTISDILCKYARSVESKWGPPSDWLDISHFPNVVNLSFELDTSHFDESAPRFVWEVELTRAEIESLTVFRLATQWRGIQTLEVGTVRHPMSFQHPVKESIWRNNIQRFEELVFVQVKKAKSYPQPLPSLRPLQRVPPLPPLPNFFEPQGLLRLRPPSASGDLRPMQVRHIFNALDWNFNLLSTTDQTTYLHERLLRRNPHLSDSLQRAPGGEKIVAQETRIMPYELPSFNPFSWAEPSIEQARISTRAGTQVSRARPGSAVSDTSDASDDSNEEMDDMDKQIRNRSVAWK